MSNKPAPRCPGCGKEMERRWQSYYGGIASVWYACNCGWRSPNGDDGNEAYDKAMQRYKPVCDGYQGATQSENSSHGCKVYGGGELNFDVPPGRYPIVCQSTRETEQGHAAGQWISVNDRLPDNEVDVLVCVTREHYSDTSKYIRFIAKAFHTDGKTNTEHSRYVWSSQYIDMEYDEEADAYIIPEGWWESVEYEDEFSVVDDFVTHWMPLPLPPKEGE